MLYIKTEGSLYSVSSERLLVDFNHNSYPMRFIVTW